MPVALPLRGSGGDSVKDDDWKGEHLIRGIRVYEGKTDRDVRAGREKFSPKALHKMRDLAAKKRKAAPR